MMMGGAKMCAVLFSRSSTALLCSGHDTDYKSTSMTSVPVEYHRLQKQLFQDSPRNESKAVKGKSSLLRTHSY